MEAERISGVRSGNSDTYAAEIAESLRFQEEIQSLIHPSFDASPAVGGSFTALLGLPTSQAVDLLHEPGPDAADSFPSEELWRFRLRESAASGLRHPDCCGPTFPSNAVLVERAESFSLFAADDSPGSSSGGASSPRLKVEQPDSDSPPSLPLTTEKPQRLSKRKERKKNKAKGAAKKSKSSEENNSAKGTAEEDTATAGDKLPYVHVRARRGQATDSHSLAERARREKINARMKLLQELVPGCSKITGTALVLEEIINHVQYLQRQVEFLSMRLASVNPRIDLSGLDSFLLMEHGPLPNGRERSALDTTLWSPDAAAATGVRRQPVQQIWHVDLLCQQTSSTAWERDAATRPHGLLDPATTVLGFDPADSGLDLCRGPYIFGDPARCCPNRVAAGPQSNK